MAESKEGVGIGWLWLLAALMIFVGVFLFATAFFFPNGVEIAKSDEPAVEQQVSVAAEAIIVDWEVVVKNPSRYYDRDIVTIVRVSDILNERAMWLGGREDVSEELFAVVSRGIDLRATDFRIYQLIKVYGTVRQVQLEDLKAQGLEVGPRTTATLSSQKGYFLIKGLIPNQPEPFSVEPAEETEEDAGILYEY